MKPNFGLSLDPRGGALPPQTPGRSQTAPGFALIVTLSLMILLTVIAVGLLSLSAISLRSSSQGSARAEAQANARLALMLAIGDLQKEMGPDQRITARAEILDSNSSTPTPDNVANPMWLGVWDSWDTWLNATGIQATYTPGRESKFRGWMVSHPSPMALKSFDTAKNAFTTSAVELVGKGTLGTAANTTLQVKVPKLPLTKGACAWWVGGENQKAQVAASKSPANAFEELSRRSQRTDIGADQLGDLSSLATDAADLAKVPDLPTLGLTGDATARTQLPEHYHDLSVESAGVLTDVRQGGLKRDLNLLLENDTLPDEFGTYRLSNPTGTRVPIRPNTGDVPAAYFPWTGGSPTGKPNFTAWYKLHQYYSFYRGGDGPGDERAADCNGLPYQRGLWGSGSPNVNYTWHNGNFDEFGYARTPMVTRIMMVLSARRVAAAGSTTKFDYKLGINPVVTIWNPYNVTLHSPRLATQLWPRNIEYKAYKDGVQLFDWRKASLGGSTTASESLDVELREGKSSNAPIILKPGESRIYSPPTGAVTGASGAVVQAYPGYQPPDKGGGIDIPVTGLSGFADGSSVELALRLSDVRGSGLGSNHQFYFILRNGVAGGQRFVEMAGNPVPAGMHLPVIPDAPGRRIIFPNLTGVDPGARTSAALAGFAANCADLLQQRILRVLAVARAYRYDTLVLGAWGCGAFGNDPKQTAADFRHALDNEFSGAFAEIVFAITDWSPERKFLGPFRDAFAD